MKTIQRTLILAAAAVLVMPAVGCSSGDTKLGKVSTIDEVVDAYVAAGGVCNWQQTDEVKIAVASGACSKSTVIAIYENTEERSRSIKMQREILQLLDPDNSTPLTLLAGENWVINSPDAEEMKEALGGTWIVK